MAVQKYPEPYIISFPLQTYRSRDLNLDNFSFTNSFSYVFFLVDKRSADKSYIHSDKVKLIYVYYKRHLPIFWHCYIHACNYFGNLITIIIETSRD